MSVAVMSVPEISAHYEQAINAARCPLPGGEGVKVDVPAKTVTIRTRAAVQGRRGAGRGRGHRP